ncbi:hypothetical protein [Streptomyces sp. NPDC059649]
MIRVPHDMHEWPEAEVRLWLAQIEAARDVTDRERALANRPPSVG